MIIGAFLTFALIIFFPADAFAWGPVTHVELARTLLDSARPELAFVNACAQNIWAFLYGGLAPDLFLAKNLQVFHKHTHNWDRAFRMYENADDDEQKSFALGYLLHLAADSVAHNEFVPCKMLENPLGKKGSHGYWEMRFEEKQPLEAWQTAKQIQKDKPSRLHAFLRVYQKPTLLPFGANVTILRGLTRTGTGSLYRSLLGSVEQHAEVPIPPAEQTEFQQRALNAMDDLLKNWREAEVVRDDPRGMASISHANLLSKELKKISRRPFASKEYYRQFGIQAGEAIRRTFLKE